MFGDPLYKIPVKAYSPEKQTWSSRYKSARTPVHSLRVVTWNVDFMAPGAAPRMECILEHLRRRTLTEKPQPSCILLQELNKDSFATLLSDPWVREHYAITPSDPKYWPRGSSYGVATLVSRHARILSSSMLTYTGSCMGRGALFVDVEMCIPGGDGHRGVLRIANTHLESLPEGQRQRSVQLSAIARVLRAPGITAGLVGGDMNIISPADEPIGSIAGLADACRDTSPKAFTWGHQPPTQYPPGRLDRVYTLPGTLDTGRVKVIGKGLKTGRGAWASDHRGLAVLVTLRAYDESSCDECRHVGQ
ncbi:Endonuclease/exonuclease/phosphatase [Epithele typhae]|uniref:Endonuclease/exonuclease/phosphatase n=1 Tax=Epithele typhae TaxID=378194 RepID=UPI0020079102|nr:Endonuclease/exonuclease/phosphatase [Epithele typhae]KAH9945449.1 Endonuclease/exonuclease/phosphatase [Epithele typhae]